MKRFFNTIHKRTEKHFFEITKKNSIPIRPVGCELCCIASNPGRILSWWPNRDPGWRVGGAGAGGRGRPPPAPAPAPSARGWGCSWQHSPRLYIPNIQSCQIKRRERCVGLEILCPIFDGWKRAFWACFRENWVYWVLYCYGIHSWKGASEKIKHRVPTPTPPLLVASDGR
jgi:hypothetical protein